MDKKDFDSIIGEEYRTFEKIFPMYYVIEDEVGLLIQEKYPKGIQNALELGTGKGTTTNAVLKYNVIETLTAVDESATMLAQANIPNHVTIVEQDALAYLKTQPKESVDLLFTGYMLHNIKDDKRKEILNNIYRVLKPGALFVNADKYAHQNAEVHEQQLAWEFNMFKKMNPVLCQEWTTHYIDDNSEEKILREENYLQTLQEIGFKDIHVRMRYQMDGIISAVKR